MAEAVNVETAERFLASAQRTFSDLASRPHLGVPLGSRRAALADVRRWRVRDFDQVLIFYLPRADGVSVIRVMHGARDWRQLLELTD